MTLTSRRPSTALSDDVLLTAYRDHVEDVARVVQEQRRRLGTTPALRPQLDDLEAELTYALVRHLRPRTVLEIGCYWGWSTTWLLAALRDNESGHLHSVDRVPHVERVVEAALRPRWTFHRADVRDRTALVRELRPDLVFVDAAHTRAFGRWVTSTLFAEVPPGTPVSVHDVYRHRTTLPVSEGRVLEDWALRGGVGLLTVARRGHPGCGPPCTTCAARRASRGRAGPAATPWCGSPCRGCGRYRREHRRTRWTRSVPTGEEW